MLLVGRFSARQRQQPTVTQSMMFSAIISWLSGLACKTKHENVHGHDQTTETDDIYPLHFIDQASMVRSSIICYNFRFNHVLDAQALHASLLQLLQIGDWRKLGGRLRLNKEGKLEIHVSRHVKSKYDKVRFSHVQLDVAIGEHPLGARLPTETGSSPSIHQGFQPFRSFSHPSDMPAKLLVKHWLTSDEPILCLHITSFTDATLVALSHPHTLADAMGMAGIMTAWSHVLSGRPDLVVPVASPRHDVLSLVGEESDDRAQDRFILEHTLMKGVSMALFVVRVVWDLLTRREVPVHHVFLPAKFVSHLRQQARDELVQAPFLSDGDLITAYFSTMIIKSRLSTGTKSRPATIFNVFNLRGRIDDTFDPDQAYVQNMMLPCTTLLSAEETRSVTFPKVALGLRKSITTQTVDSQVRALVRIAKTSGATPMFVTSPASMVMACTNWSKAQFSRVVDFSAAAVPQHRGTPDADTKSDAPGKPAMFWGSEIASIVPPRDLTIIYGKNATGDYWILGNYRPETWDLIRKDFAAFD
ncbi:hypothetical protein B0T17DRAFT_512570 [Bombardia bombarda]|uniref:BCL5p n=1 Tax=Bombardia bombarda TaxID=252184 RepID=A0AA39TQV1_9PEZI|nr:hypothetical protein B0T17DRAFT_512570 [Bombardia bombarda]